MNPVSSITTPNSWLCLVWTYCFLGQISSFCENAVIQYECFLLRSCTTKIAGSQSDITLIDINAYLNIKVTGQLPFCVWLLLMCHTNRKSTGFLQFTVVYTL